MLLLLLCSECLGYYATVMCVYVYIYIYVCSFHFEVFQLALHFLMDSSSSQCSLEVKRSFPCCKRSCRRSKWNFVEENARKNLMPIAYGLGCHAWLFLAEVTIYLRYLKFVSSIYNIKKFLFFLLDIFYFIYMNVCGSVRRGQRGVGFPETIVYRQSLATKHGFWDPNSGPLKKSIKLSSSKVCLMVMCAYAQLFARLFFNLCNLLSVQRTFTDKL